MEIKYQRPLQISDQKHRKNYLKLALLGSQQRTAPPPDASEAWFYLLFALYFFGLGRFLALGDPGRWGPPVKVCAQRDCKDFGGYEDNSTISRLERQQLSLLSRVFITSWSEGKGHHLVIICKWLPDENIKSVHGIGKGL